MKIVAGKKIRWSVLRAGSSPALGTTKDMAAVNFKALTAAFFFLACATNYLLRIDK